MVNKGAERLTDEEPRSGYEGWLDEIAGERVKTLPLVWVWAGIVGLGCAIAYLLGAQSERTYLVVTAVVSAPYWFWAVPRHLRHRRSD